jgi:molybdopterin-guanine dinucleotide biosynthesis protein A
MLIENIPVVIFAGGKSSRMGQDKSLLPFGGFSTLAEYQFQRLSNIFKHVFISAKNNKFSFINSENLILDSDKHSVFAPTLGLFSVMEYFKNNSNFKHFMILSVDAPFFGETEINALNSEIIENSDLNLIISETENGLEPLLSIYSVNLIENFREMLIEDNHKLNFFIKNYEQNRVKKLFFDSDKHKEAFVNLNYFDEYKKYNIN